MRASWLLLQKMADEKLSPALDGKYELRDYAPGIFAISGFGDVDMRTVSLETADKIHASGLCPHLVKADPKPKKGELPA